MKILATILLCSIIIVGHAQEEEMKLILSTQNLSASGVTIEGFDEESLIALDIEINKSSDSPTSSLTTLDQVKSNQQFVIKGSTKIETNTVSVVISNTGIKYHIADYYDGSRVVTALDGSLRGLQLIGFAGNIIAQSANVEWHGNYFLHRYPGGKVTSYSSKQVAELK